MPKRLLLPLTLLLACSPSVNTQQQPTCLPAATAPHADTCEPTCVCLSISCSSTALTGWVSWHTLRLRQLRPSPRVTHEKLTISSAPW